MRMRFPKDGTKHGVLSSGQRAGLSRGRPTSTRAITAPLPQLYEPTYQRLNFASGTGERPQHDVLHVRPYYREPRSSEPVGYSEWSQLTGPGILRCPICNCRRDSQGCGCGD
jgi:hypothetical protein